MLTAANCMGKKGKTLTTSHSGKPDHIDLPWFKGIDLGTLERKMRNKEVIFILNYIR